MTMLREVKTRRAKEAHDLGSLELIVYKLEQIHEDVSGLKNEVQVLNEDFVRRKLIHKIIIMCGGTIIALLGWLIDQAHVISKLFTGN